MIRNLIMAALVLWSGATFAAYTCSAAPAETKPAPAFALEAMDGKRYEVGGKRDKPLMLNFWASWCGPCKTEAPDLQRLYAKYGGQFDLYAVNMTPSDDMEAVKAFVAKYRFTFPVLLDKNLKVAPLYRFTVIPTSFLIDRDGNITEVVHLLPPNELEAKIKRLIAG